KAQEEEQRRKAQEEEQKRKALEEEQKRKAQEEEQRRKAQEEEQKRKALEQEQRRKALEEEQRRKAQEEEQRRKEEEERVKIAEQGKKENVKDKEKERKRHRFGKEKEEFLDSSQLQLSYSSDFLFNTSWKKSDFQQKERLGKGGFGVVRHVIEKRTQLHAAWKEVNYETPEEIQIVNKEIEIMQKIYEIVLKSNSSFIHIVQPLGLIIDKEDHKAYIVLEYCSKG
ncbi:MAG: hypothetical protein EZS28_053304, partial [Streblomastix strix]